MDLTKLKIKKLGPADAASFKLLLNIFVEVFEEPRQHLADDKLQQLLQNPLFHVFVAEWNDNVVGGCTLYELTRYYAEKPEWFIYDVAIRKEFQKNGIGKQLISSLIVEADDAGIGNIFVMAHDEDIQAVKFYESTTAASEKVTLFVYDL
jgi:aminoglycoside 3-N-acetyltransferase I